MWEGNEKEAKGKLIKKRKTVFTAAAECASRHTSDAVTLNKCDIQLIRPVCIARKICQTLCPVIECQFTDYNFCARTHRIIPDRQYNYTVKFVHSCGVVVKIVHSYVNYKILWSWCLNVFYKTSNLIAMDSVLLLLLLSHQHVALFCPPTNCCCGEITWQRTETTKCYSPL